MHIHNVYSYSSGDIKFKIHDGSIESGRYYVDIDAFSCFLGALIEESLEDLGFNGASLIDGSPGVSKSHKNGMIFDLRYLNKHKNGKKTLVTDSDLDYDRQVKLIEALYKFGFAKYNRLSMLSYHFTHNGIINSLLPHSVHFTIPPHENHLHVQGLLLSAILKVKEKTN